MNYTILLTAIFASHIISPEALFTQTPKMPARTIEFHAGELALHNLLNVPRQSNPTASGLPPSYGARIAASPLLALGTLDRHNRPWTTLWGGEAGGVARPIAEDVLGVRSRVDVVDDPVLSALWDVDEEAEGVKDGEVVQPGLGGDGGRLVAGLGIDLRTRDRVKFAGRMVAGAVNGGEVQVAVKVEESLGNCPKYLNKKDVEARASIEKGRVERGLPLGEGALGVVERADMVFLTSGHEKSMDTNHRGGPRGFVRVARNDVGGVEIVYPEFSGNRLYQTLGNLKVNPLIGIAIPDFETSDVLYLTGSASILVGRDAAAHLPHTKLAVKVKVAAAVFVESGLPFVGTPLEASPYNPPLRRLLSEQQQTPLSSETPTGRSVTLLRREVITPTIARFVFRLEAAGARWEAGQYITLDFSGELDVGWSHMRDDEPQSLNDDFVRTFTVSRPPSEDCSEVEITARRKGPVTDLLWRWNLRVPLEVPLLGFGGEEAFRLGRRGREDGVEEVFVAAGVGITPLLAQAGGVLGLGGRLRVYWSVRGQDVKLVRDVCGRIDGLAGVMRVFITGRVEEEEEAVITEIEALGAAVEKRRLGEADVKGGTSKRRFFLCTGQEMLKALNGWLEGEEVVWEDFAF
ncbi:Oxidoreductase FAD-binding domain-containing protein [Colletotrichum higginsianum IMI 349063]|uniref:Oxidoreductase FAD-binding domain-containing protein n=2 Tax=Colletotrichum higginsianum TaxID=80884 RepID=A0A1B7YBN6_COLHI|nr:Oxidoreductase FAD-binding domain-containing protein [Colletotrichum higginsianum IMI 349063]OBR09449.1 Oxidoreductase FAD-binding domain-containing protein [Colletotrichum higginsianum IMI 349063]